MEGWAVRTWCSASEASDTPDGVKANGSCGEQESGKAPRAPGDA